MNGYCEACKHFKKENRNPSGGGVCGHSGLQKFDRVSGPYAPWVGPANSSPELINPGKATLDMCDEIGGFEKR